jgi:hypothetical protein
MKASSVRAIQDNHGFTLTELSIVLVSTLIILASAVPFVDIVLDQYNLVLSAQGITTQLQGTRMRAVSSNEPLRLRFGPAANSYRVELDNGTVLAGPFWFQGGIALNDELGDPVSFPGDVVRFLPTGSLPTSGTGSAGRVKLINQSGVRVDIVVDAGGLVRQTPAFKTATPPF